MISTNAAQLGPFLRGCLNIGLLRTTLPVIIVLLLTFDER